MCCSQGYPLKLWINKQDIRMLFIFFGLTTRLTNFPRNSLMWRLLVFSHTMKRGSMSNSNAIPQPIQYKHSSLTVTQSNALIESCYRLSLEEKRLVMASAAQVDPRYSVPDEITTTAEAYAEIFNIKIDAAYQQIRSAADSLYDRTIKMKNKDDQGREVNVEMRWIYRKAITKPRSGQVTLSFSPDIKPFLGDLKDRFKSYKIDHVKGLKSIHSIRLYELLYQYKDIGYRWFLVPDFREKFCLEGLYPRDADLKRWVVRPAAKEVTKKTNLDVDVQFEKKARGRGTQKIWFNFSLKPQLAMPF